MSKSNSKQIVEKIKKLAQNMPVGLTGFFPGSEPKGTTTPAVPGTTSFVGPPAPDTAVPAGVGGHTPRDVARMQSELMNLSRAVSSQIATPATGTPQTPEEKKEADSRLSFNNFIVEHYLRPAGGVEFDADPSQTQMANKNPNQPARMNMIADTMSRVGGPANELSADNNWGPRTNGALWDAYALASGLLKMAHDFHLVSQVFDDANLSNLKEMLPYKATDLTPQEKTERAQKLEGYIVAIRHLFNEVQQHILNKPAYRATIEGDQAYLTYKAQPTSQLAPQQVEAIKQKFPNGFSVPLDQQGKQNAQFTVDDLVNLASLNKKIDSVNTQYQVKLDPYNTLTAISNQIGGS
jgi:hypothetical protein